jgi:DNA-directed DNA polymerase
MGEYLNGEKAQLILMSYKLNDGETKCVVGEEEMAGVLATFDWSQVALASHNIKFDARIIIDKFGHTPAFFFDTLGMMSAVGGNVIVNGNDLGSVAKLLQGAGIPIEDKGEERDEASRKRLFRFPDGRWYMHEEEINEKFIAEFRSKNYTKKGTLKKGKKDLVEVARSAVKFFEDYRAYCIHDTEICYAALQYFIKLLPVNEIKFQDMMSRCYLYPRLALDADVLHKEKRRLDKRRLEKVRPVADKYFDGNIETAKEYLRSKRLFGVLLKTMGGVTDQDIFDANSRDEEIDYAFIIPTKVSEKTGKVDYAFSLTDESFHKLADLSPELREVCDARMEMASSIEHSRTQRFIDSTKWEPKFGLPYKISGAATHRLSGEMSLNVQNLSSGRKEGQTTALRDSISSPDDNHTIVVSDSSQIELRITAFMANEKILLDAFKHSQDVYSVTAELIYGVPWQDINAGRKAGDKQMAHFRTIGKVTSLGGIYGIGWAAFMDYASVVGGVTLTEDEAKDIIGKFRNSYPALPQFWKLCGKVLDHMLAGGSGYFGGPTGKLFFYDGNYQIHGKTVPSIIGPDGMRLSYYKLCKRRREYEDGSVRDNFAYWGLKEGRYQWVYIHSSKLTENLGQYLAFALMKWQGLKINEKYPTSLNTHDEWGLLVEDKELYPAITYVMESMRTVPEWLDGLVVDCECEMGRQYGKCEEVSKAKLQELKNTYEVQ